jgi:hypothetical protein
MITLTLSPGNIVMSNTRGFAWSVATAVALATALTAAAVQNADKVPESARPKIKLTAQPQISMAPSRIVLTAELRGGADDFEEYYCPTIVWEWGDDTKSESKRDCEPYQPGKSEIRRRFTVEHVYRFQGEYKILFHLKHGDKSLGTASVSVQVRPGLNSIGQ